jgi:acyl carrier protein
MREEVILKIKTVLMNTLNLSSIETIHGASKLKDDLGLDSMSSLTFLLALEDSINGFKVDPDTLEMEDLATLDSITNYVCEEVYA